MLRAKLVTAIALSTVVSVTALAAQSATVIAQSAEVHQFPNASSPLIGHLPKDAKIKMSSDLTRDIQGEYWFKVKMPSGEAGYLRATEVQGDQLERELKVAGVASHFDSNQERQQDELPWSFVVRLMGSGGFYTGSQTYEGGGEIEGSTALFLKSHGYLHRMLSFGAGAQIFSTDTVLFGTLIYRLFTPYRAEPEVRVRLGTGLTSQAFVTGLNIGVRYPFSLASGSHLSGYGEAGGLAAVAVSSVPTHLFVSAGVGYHF